jgi:hypothetical protein
MSNFLQRIAASVTPTVNQKPAEARIQPTLGSAFMPPATLGQANFSPAGTSSFELNESITTDSLSAASILSTSETIFPTSELASEHLESRTSSANRYSAGDRLLYETPLLPLSDYIDSAIQRHFSKSDRQNSDTTIHAELSPSGTFGERSQEANGERASSNSDAARKTGVRVGSIQPVAATPVGQRPKESEKTSANRRVDNARRVNSGGADDVYIHIGRIEVAAAAPPPPRSSVPSPRKSLSLDEYLRRGNGGRG